MKLSPEDILDTSPLSEGIVSYLNASGIRNIQRYHGGLRRFASASTLTLNSGFKVDAKCTSIIGAPAPDNKRLWKGVLKGSDGVAHEGQIYSKIIHLCNPFEFMKQNQLQSFMPAPQAESHDLLRKHAISRHNQASVDATVCYILSRLGQAGLTPHSIKYLETVCGIADNYEYKITDDFLTLRRKPWFWKQVQSNGLKVDILDTEIIETEDDYVSVDPETIKKWIETAPEELDSASDNNSISDEIASEELELSPVSPHLEMSASMISFVAAGEEVACELREADEDDFFCDDAPPEQLVGTGQPHDEDIETTESEAMMDELEDRRGEIFLNCKDIPVLVNFQEAGEGTMDDLLMEEEDFESETVERKWSAWVFQVVAALSVYQKYVKFCHNDLHTNNIVWVPTSETHIYYKAQDGQTFKVPTHGKLFKLIDFGRATCEVGDLKIMSSDFAPGQDAFGQYNWGPFADPEEDEAGPNPSFDLCRLAVSLFGHFCKDEEEPRRDDDSDLLKLLWSWMTDDKGESVLIDEDGLERFPGFDLYVHIGRCVHGAVPGSQFSAKPFSQFKWNGKEARAAANNKGFKWWPIYKNTNIDIE